ncbi:hypothetical protein BDW68DRAFT_161239 [Aspergillus falconensis]
MAPLFFSSRPRLPQLGSLLRCLLSAIACSTQRALPLAVVRGVHGHAAIVKRRPQASVSPSPRAYYSVFPP